jgi:hypothetical protein
MTSFLLVLLLVVVAVPALASPSSRPEILNPSLCASLPPADTAAANIAGGKNAAHYLAYMLVCPIGPASNNRISVLTLDISKADSPNDLFWKNGKRFNYATDMGPPDPLPYPVILDAGHRIIGVLPQQFLGTDPITAKYSFSDWVEGFPRRIALYVDDPTVTSPGWPYCPPPFLWNEKEQKFIEAKGDFYAKCK